MSVLGVHAGTSVGGSRHLRGGSGNLVVSANVGGESGHNTGRSLGLVESHVNDHIGEEITELRDGVTDSAVELGRTRVRAHRVVLHTESRKRLEMRVHKEQMCSLDVHKRGSRIGDIDPPLNLGSANKFAPRHSLTFILNRSFETGLDYILSGYKTKQLALLPPISV